MGVGGNCTPPPGQLALDDDLGSRLAMYVVVYEHGLNLADAESSCGMPGAVAHALEGSALSAGVVAAGDFLCRVNHVDVLGMAYEDVLDVVKDASAPRVLAFAPPRLVKEAQRMDRDRDQPVDQVDASYETSKLDIAHHQYDVLKRGYVYVHDRAVSATRWTKRYVVVRAAAIECLESARSVALWSELDLAGRCCSVRALPPTELENAPPPMVSYHALELHAGDEVWALAFASKTHQSAWLGALSLACAMAKALGQDTEDTEDLVSSADNREEAPPLDASQAAMLHRLLEYEKATLRGLSCDEMKRRTELIDTRMRAIGSVEVTHPDPRIQRSLREEYARRQHDKRILTDQIAASEPEETRKDREWEDANAAANLAALRAIRRCLPVDVMYKSEDELLARVGPRGECMPPEMARKFERTSVLTLLRMAPADIQSDDQIVHVEEMSTEGLTLTERRALHAHFREFYDILGVGVVRNERRRIRKCCREWFLDMKRTLKQLLDCYDRHVAQFGPLGDHMYADQDDESSIGCPLRGCQCPLSAVRAPAYDIDLGFPEGDEFQELVSTGKKRNKDARNVPLETVGQNIQADLADSPEIDGSLTDGFLAAATETFGASSIWNDPVVLELRLQTTDVQISDRSNTSMGQSANSAGTSTDVVKGIYSGTPVAIKRLANTSKTIGNAAALATICTVFHDLRHPNLVPLIGLTWTKAVDLQVITSWVPGGDLRSLLDTSEATLLTWENFKCQVAIDVASAIAQIHCTSSTTGIGAVTSRNVMLDRENTVASLNIIQLPCIDMGDARDRVPSPVRYVAPEVVLGGPTTPDSDIYALGVLMTELDTTKRPFHDAVNPNGAPMEDMLITLRVARRNMRPTLSPDCPRSIAAIVEKCLAQDPEQRPSAVSVKYKLRGILKNEL